MNNHTNLVSVGDETPVLKYLLKYFHLSESYNLEKGMSEEKINRANVLCLNASGLELEDIIGHKHIVDALSSNIPIVIDNPTPELLKELTGVGAKTRQAVVINTSNQGYYIYAIRNNEDVEIGMHDGKIEAELPEAGDADKDRDAERPERPTDDTPENYEPPIPTPIELVDWTDEGAVDAMLWLLGNLDEIEKRMEDVVMDTSDDIPPNREWSAYWETEFSSWVLHDPSGETKRTQTPRYGVTFIFRLLAADKPVKKKVLDIKTGGRGFQPKLADTEFIRYDDKHRGYVQGLTSVTFTPVTDGFGSVQEYIPRNTADESTVISGYKWDIGFSGKRLDFSYGENKSISKTSKDFRTLAEMVGDGIRFYHNVMEVGGDTKIDAVKIFEYLDNNETQRLFKIANLQGYVRSWPKLSRELLPPYSEVVWYNDADQDTDQKLKVKVDQSLIYCWTKHRVTYIDFYWVVVGPSTDTDFSIDFSKVDYNDPED